jgi:TDG/mug DNA glycosylase family protein
MALMTSHVQDSSETLDVIDQGLKAIFCGLNRPASAAHPGRNFATPSNRFWSVLHLAGFTATRLEPREERRLLSHGYGITAVVPHLTSKAEEVPPEEFRRYRPEFEARMQSYAPRALAFLGKRAFAAMTQQTNVDWGRQSVDLAGTMTWILPNPSGRNRAFTLDALVRAYAEFRVALE